MTYDEINAKIGADWAELNARHAQEKLNLRQSHAQLWAEFKGDKSGVNRVNEHNAAVSAAAAQRKQAKADAKAAAAVAKILTRIKVRFLLAADTVEGAIAELQAQIAVNRIHKDKESEKGVIAMERAIIELGGVPRRDAPVGSPATPAPGSPTEAEMDALLSEPPKQ